MTPQSFAERVVTLEKQMASLQELPQKVDNLALQVSQLRSEMRSEFSAIRGEMATRGEMAAEFAAVRGEMAAEFAAVRGEMAVEFAAVRAEMASEFVDVRIEMASEFAASRREMASEFAAMRAETATNAALAALRTEMDQGFSAPTGALALAVEGLRAEIRAGDLETRRQMRVLHEELVGRIALLQEGLSGAKRKSAKPRRPR